MKAVILLISRSTGDPAVLRTHLRHAELVMVGMKEEMANLALPLLIEYGVMAEEKDQALEVYETFKHSPVAVSLLRSYYSDLPEAREEMAVDLRVVASRQGADLIVLQSTNHDYLYLHSDNHVLYIGEFANGVEDDSILQHFEFKNKDDFWRKTSKHPGDHPRLEIRDQEKSPEVCVACGVKPGEAHILGCPVEQCPWCQAQLSRCDCRFDKLGVTAIDDDEQLDQFEELLEQKGRILFKAEHNPSYPTAGSDPPPFSNRSDK